MLFQWISIFVESSNIIKYNESIVVRFWSGMVSWFRVRPTSKRSSFEKNPSDHETWSIWYHVVLHVDFKLICIHLLHWSLKCEWKLRGCYGGQSCERRLCFLYLLVRMRHNMSFQPCWIVNKCLENPLLQLWKLCQQWNMTDIGLQGHIGFSTYCQHVLSKDMLAWVKKFKLLQ